MNDRMMRSATQYQLLRTMTCREVIWIDRYRFEYRLFGAILIHSVRTGGVEAASRWWVGWIRDFTRQQNIVITPSLLSLAQPLNVREEGLLYK